MKNRSGFTLVELLIVVAIIGVLVALLAGGIRRTLESSKKRGRSTEVQALQTAVMTYWHDVGKPPISLTKGTYVYKFKDNNNEVFEKLITASKNAMGKTYLDKNQLRTKKNGQIMRLEKDSESLVDYKGNFYQVTIELDGKTVKVE